MLILPKCVQCCARCCWWWWWRWCFGDSQMMLPMVSQEECQSPGSIRERQPVKFMHDMIAVALSDLIWPLLLISLFNSKFNSLSSSHVSQNITSWGWLELQWERNDDDDDWKSRTVLRLESNKHEGKILQSFVSFSLVCFPHIRPWASCETW